MSKLTALHTLTLQAATLQDERVALQQQAEGLTAELQALLRTQKSVKQRLREIYDQISTESRK